MGTRVWAEIEVYPFDREALERTGPGRDFLEALDEVVDSHEHTDETGTEGVFSLQTVNYGTFAFSEAQLPQLATAAGLIYRHRDDGGGTWDGTEEVYLPTGRSFAYAHSMNTGKMLTRSQYDYMCSRGRGDQVGNFFALLALSMPELAAEHASGALAKRIDQIGLWPVPEPAPAPDEELIFDMPDPPALRGPGSNQYQDKPPRPGATRRA